MNLRKKSTLEEFERALTGCKPEDFDGHTEFYRLTPEQRLEWLCQAATFVYEFKGKAKTGARGRSRQRSWQWFQKSSVVYSSYTLDCRRNSPLTGHQHE